MIVIDWVLIAIAVMLAVFGLVHALNVVVFAIRGVGMTVSTLLAHAFWAGSSVTAAAWLLSWTVSAVSA